MADYASPALDEAESLQIIVRHLQSLLHTSQPANVISFNPETQLLSVQLGSVAVATIEGEVSLLPVPPLVNVPLMTIYSGTTGFGLTHPVAVGDPCYVWFAERAVDEWYDTARASASPETVAARMHDLSDGFASLGPIPTPYRINDYKNDVIEMRNRDREIRVTVAEDHAEIKAGTSVITLLNDGTITMTAPSGLTINANTLVNGNLDCRDTISATDFTGREGASLQSSVDLRTTASMHADTAVTTDGTIEAAGTIHSDTDVTTNSCGLNSACP